MTKTAEQWAKEKGTPGWLFAAARTNRWAIGRELTEDEYDQVVYDTANIRLGSQAVAPPVPAPKPVAPAPKK